MIDLCSTAYSSNQFAAILVLCNPLFSEGLALAELGDGLVANGSLEFLDRQAVHGLAQGLKDTSLVAAVLGNLLCLGLQNSLLTLNGLVGDHGARAQPVEGGLDILRGERGEGLGGQNRALLGQCQQDLRGEVAGGRHDFSGGGRTGCNAWVRTRDVR